MKHVVCFSGGHSSALVAVEVVRRYGTADVVLLNHDIAPHAETADIKRFKAEVAARLGLPVTYANHPDFPNVDQFDVTVRARAFKVRNGQELCTHRLKTQPFMRWLADNISGKDCIIYYGFDANEGHRIQRRSSALALEGYRTAFPLAHWERTIQSTHEIGVRPPLIYDLFKHANCIGCLKAGKQHWYIVYLHRPDMFERGKWAEEIIGHSIHKDAYLDELEPLFAQMKAAGITTTEHEDGRTFWARARRALNSKTQLDLFDLDDDAKPCECVF